MRLKFALEEVDVRSGTGDLPLLAVSIHLGVVPRSDFTDDESRADDTSAYKRCRSGDLVVNRMRAFQGALGVAPTAGLVSPDYAVLRVIGPHDARFVSHLLRSPWGVGQMTARLRGIGGSGANGAVRTPRLNVADLGEIDAWLPDHDEQRAIADFLDGQCARIDELRGGLSRQVDAIDDLRRAVTREAVASLRCVPLKHAASVVDCKHRTAEYVSDGGFPLISTREVRRGLLLVDDATRRVCADDFDDLRSGGRDPRRGDVIYSRNATVGVAAYVDGSADVCMGQDVVLITRRPRDSELLSYALNWGVNDQVERLSVGSTFSRINVATIRELIVPDDKPTAEEAATRHVRQAFERFEALENEVAGARQALAEYRDALINEAVTGQLDVARMSDVELDEGLHVAHDSADSREVA